MQLITVTPPAMVLRVTRGRKVVEHQIQTLNEASAWWCAYRDEHGYRSSTMPRVEIVVDGKPRAYVSFNGNVFEGTERGWKPGQRPLFDLCADEASR